jgi:hypothetical protein
MGSLWLVSTVENYTVIYTLGNYYKVGFWFMIVDAPVQCSREFLYRKYLLYRGYQSHDSQDYMGEVFRLQ